MNSSSRFYISTSIAYVNAAPHIGFAMECVQADALARFNKALGKEVFSLTGTDEHGVKLFQTAKLQNLTPQELADQNAEKFKLLQNALCLSNNLFIRTTDDLHKRGAAKLWQKINEAGDLYKDKYAGYYCVGCEAYVTEKDLVDGECPTHKKKPEWLEEENYYFKLSKYGPILEDYINTGKLRVVPEERKNEILSLIKSGLRDVSFSRPKSILPWGIEVPDDPDQVMYVWCDALSNYLTALGYADESETYNKFWPADVHLIGKDILRFHAALWPAMLLSAELPTPKAVYVHGFITSEGQKMSKSLGNVVDPFEYVEEFGTDALRYYLLREIPTTGDGDFSRQRFIDLYNDELANNFGNFVNRVISMTGKYFEFKVPTEESHEEIKQEITRTINNYEASFTVFDLREMIGNVINLINLGNKYIDEEKPWILAKDPSHSQKLAAVMKGLLEILFTIAVLFFPVMPEKMSLLMKEVFAEDVSSFLFSQLKNEETFLKAETIGKISALFPRIEVAS